WPKGADPLRAGKLLIGLEEPQGWGDYALMAGASVPLTMAGGMGAEALAARMGVPALVARATPMLGRVAVSAGLGGARGATQGTGGVYEALTDAVVAGLTEGVAGGVTQAGGRIPGVKIPVGLKAWGEPARAFRAAVEKPKEVLSLIASRLPQ